VPVNCGAIPEALIDSHLFGHARGAFTGAMQEHAGMIRAASKGTLLLDEVSELPLTAQVRLLRLMQDREAQPVGYSQPVTVDVRIIAATNIDLHEAVAAGRFREDLLYRMDIVRLHVRPLRERADELPGLIDEFNREFAAMHGRDELTFTADALAFLSRCAWPGNVRQVRTVIERLHVLCPDDSISVESLTTYGGLAENGMDAAAVKVEQVRLAHVKKVVQQTNGSVSEAASKLGVHRSTLYRWLRDQTPGDVG
jgi:DNA-binding NtrC family response regulator